MTRVIVGDLRTGRRWSDVPFTKVSWSTRVGAIDSIEVTVTLSDPDVRKLDLRSAAAVGKSFLGIVEGEAFSENGWFVAAGPVWQHTYEANESNDLTITASGWESYFATRVILPPAAASGSVPIILPEGTAPIVVGPDDTREAGDSNPALDTTFTGFDLGTIGAKLEQQVLAWPGSPELFVFPAARTGGHTRTYKASALKRCDDAVNELTRVEGGPEIFHETRWRADKLGIEVLYRSGTESQPRLSSPPPYGRLDFSVEAPIVEDLEVTVSGERLAGQAWLNGGRNVNKAIIRRGFNSTLTDEGYPLMEIIESHPTASEVDTLDSYAAELVRVGSAPTEFWSLSLRTDVPPAKGDWIDIVMPEGAYIPKDVYRRRIMGIASDEKSDKKFKLTIAEAPSG